MAAARLHCHAFKVSYIRGEVLSAFFPQAHCIVLLRPYLGSILNRPAAHITVPGALKQRILLNIALVCEGLAPLPMALIGGFVVGQVGQIVR